MPTTRLPSDPSFENLKKQAKTLQKSVRAGEAESLALVREFHPRAGEATADFKIADAQLVTARRYGFATWARLKEHLAIVEQFTWAPAESAFTDPVDEFIRLACLNYGGDHASHRERARQIFAEHPEYARANIAAAATVGDTAIVSALLAQNPKLANERSGPFRWPPLLYACYSRLNSTAAQHSTFDVGRVLLEHGGDPNAGFLWRGLHSPFTALTGVFGDGENGLTHQPPHSDCLRFARLLLSAGADPNDSQTLYNRHFHANDDYLNLLFEFGLGKDKGGPWFNRLGEYLSPPPALIAEEVWNAAKKGYFERVKLLARHGVALDERGMRDGRTPYETALRCGHADVAAFLAERGAKVVELPPEQALAAAIVAGDRARVRAMLAASPRLLEQLGEKEQAELISRAAETHKLDSIRLMAELGFDVNAMIYSTALHQAAWCGDVTMVKLLLELGADPAIQDRSHHATPLGWATYNGQAEVIAILKPLEDAAAKDKHTR